MAENHACIVQNLRIEGKDGDIIMFVFVPLYMYELHVAV